MTLTAADTRAGLRPQPLRRRAAEPGGRSGRWPLRRWFAVGATATALLVVLATALGGVALYRLSVARSALLDQVAPALQTAQDLSVALLNQETGVRGFDLSARPEFLDPYRAGQAAEREAATALRNLASGGALGPLASDVDRVEQAARAWRTGFAEPTITAGGLDPVRGRVLFTEVRAALAGMLNDLRAEQAAARQRVNAAAAFVLTAGIGIAVVLAAFLVAAGLGLRSGVLRPLSRLAGQVREVVSGDVQREVRATGPREIGELAEDVDAMRVHILRELDSAQQVNRRLDDQARELERSNRDLEQFAYVASHDLQEPLRKVSSFCQLLQRRYGGQLDERADQYIGFAVDGAQRMQRLINDLLAFSRVGRTTAGFVLVELGAVATATAAGLGTARTEVDGEITVGELPRVPGDPALLRQLFANLIGNGLKFHRDGVPPVVRVSARPAVGEDGPDGSDGAWEIAVADNGIGIEAEYADKVFVIFQRLHGRELYRGTGIGLALAKKIVEFHGGRIWLDTDSPGPGTTIRFTLPATVENATVENATEDNEERPREQP